MSGGVEELADFPLTLGDSICSIASQHLVQVKVAIWLHYISLERGLLALKRLLADESMLRHKQRPDISLPVWLAASLIHAIEAVQLDDVRVAAGFEPGGVEVDGLVWVVLKAESRDGLALRDVRIREAQELEDDL